MDIEISFSGHKNIRSIHAGTIEITKDPDITPRADCIIGVNADMACIDIVEPLRTKLQNTHTRVIMRISVDEMYYEIQGRGDTGLCLEHGRDIVIRKSGFVCPRTLAVMCNRASVDIPCAMISRLQNPSARGILGISVI